MARAINKCPNCGEPVTPFAAGCAICGTDIASLRKARESSPARVRVPQLPRIDDDALRIIIGLLVAIAAPFIGVLLASWFAWQLNEEGKTIARNVMLVIAALAVVSLMAPFWFWRLIHGG